MKAKSLTDFEKRVYKAAMSIPLGKTRTYKWIAAKAGNPKACRAVGQILKKNPFPLLIPCHRVVSSSGDLGGFAWGRECKLKLLDLERHIKQLML